MLKSADRRKEQELSLVQRAEAIVEPKCLKSGMRIQRGKCGGSLIRQTLTFIKIENVKIEIN